jgi:hypothetical protein
MPVQTTSPGQAIEFVVRASVTVDTEDLQLIVSVPQTVTVIGGKLHWQGALLNGQEKQLRFTASLSNAAVDTMDEILIQVQAAIISSASSVTAAAETDVKTPNPSQLAASAFYRWPSGVAKAAAIQSLPLNSRIVDRSGLKIHEYELRP